MQRPFDLEWFGGAAQKYFRKMRPGVDDLPWGTLDPKRYPPALVDRARLSWTEAAFNEYCTASAFAELVQALLAVSAPVDLIAMASDFLADEMLHVELTARLATELGGGVPYNVDFDRLAPPFSESARTPLERANELVVRLCCVGEVFSVQMLAGTMRSAAHPLTRGILERIVEDEAPHGRFGWLYLDWVEDRLDETERARLAVQAVAMLDVLRPYWARLRSKVTAGVTTEGYKLSDVRELGWMESSAYARTARGAVRTHVAKPLARYGIVIPEAEIERLLA